MTSKNTSGMLAEEFSANRLVKIYEDYVRESRARGRDGVDPGLIDTTIGWEFEHISRRLLDSQYTFTQYREVLISKGAFKAPRQISIPTARDRIALKAMSQALSDRFPSRSPRIPQMVVEGVQEAINSKRFDGFARLDIQNFYPSVSHDILVERLGDSGVENPLISAIRRALATPTVSDGAPKSLVENRRGIPQGLSISNILAEIYMQPIDSRIGSYAEIRYFRFVDDILILGKLTDVERLYSAVLCELTKLRLEAHDLGRNPAKSCLGRLEEGFTYLGYHFAQNGTQVAEPSIKRLQARIFRLFTRYDREVVSAPQVASERLRWHLDLVVSGCFYKGSSRGWVQYFRQVTDPRTHKSLDVTIMRLLARRPTLSGVTIKKFVRSYWESVRTSTSSGEFVPNFDTYTVEQMADLLSRFTPADLIAHLPDSEIKARYFAFIDKAVHDLERDIGSFS